MTRADNSTGGARARLLAALRSGQGATDVIVAQGVQLLKESWTRDLSVSDVASDALACELLVCLPVFPVWLERTMTRIRRRLLFGAPTDELAHLAAAVAIQCHLNEYAWAEDGQETERVEALAARLADLGPDQVVALASYRALAPIPGADALLTRGWSGPVAEVLQEQIAAVREEQAIMVSLPTLTPVRGAVSDAVRAQYEANPYPRWRRAGRGSILTHVGDRALPARPDVLIAGCGTGRHAIQSAYMLPGSSTLAVDLSRTSLAYAVRKTRELGLADRITYGQADLMVIEGGRQFDIVQSAGVLHHMSDPFEGARRICRLLKPGGFLALGLYSARARAHLKPAQQLARHYSPATVRALRQAIINAPDLDPIRGPVVASRDFYATSGCRDLLMHVQEHQLGIPDLRRILDENGLTFMGFHQFSMPEVRSAYQAMFPHDPSGLDLEAWDVFEAKHVSVFRRMYQFWAVKQA